MSDGVGDGKEEREEREKVFPVAEGQFPSPFLSAASPPHSLPSLLRQVTEGRKEGRKEGDLTYTVCGQGASSHGRLTACPTAH